MQKIKLNKDICEEHISALRIANEQWFYGYFFSLEDYSKLNDALVFFENIQEQLIVVHKENK